MTPNHKISRSAVYSICMALLVASAIAAGAFHRSDAPNQSARSLVDAQSLAQQNPIKPYVAQFEERVNNPAKHLAFMTMRLTEGVREDGSKVKRAEYFGVKGHMFTERRLYLPNDISVIITDDTKTIVAQHAKEWSATSVDRLDPHSGCQNDFKGNQKMSLVDGPTETLLGYRAVHLKQMKELSSSSEWSQWFLPEIGCIQAKQVVLFRDSNGLVTDSSERKLTLIALNPPAAELFTIPRDYDQVSPSEAIQRRAILLNIPMPPNELALLKKADAAHSSNRVDLSSLQ